MPIGLFSPYSRICTRWPICCSFWGEVCIGMIYSWYCIGSALRLLLARMPIVFWSDGWWGVPLCFWFPRVLPTCYDRFHFIATYLCGICLLSICWNNSYGRTSILWTTGWGCIIKDNTLEGRKFRLMYRFVWSFCSEEEVCRHEDRFLLLVRIFIVPPIVFFRGGGIPFFVWPTFFPSIIDRYGVGVCGMLYLVADLLFGDEKTTRTYSCSRFRFCQTSTFYQWLSWRVSQLWGLVDFVWRWIPSFGLLGMGFDDAPVCRSLYWRMLDMVIERPRLIVTHDPSVELFFFFIVRCPPSGLCLPWRLDLGKG